MVCIQNKWGLKFCIQPLNLDLFQILVNFHFGRDKEEEYIPAVYKTEKYNLPKDHNTPKESKNFIGAVKSEIMDPHNINKVECNLPPEELRVLKNLLIFLKGNLHI